MNKIEELLNDIDIEAQIYDREYGLPLSSKVFKAFAVNTIKYFCKQLIEEAKYLTSGDSVSEFLEDYINPKVEVVEEEMIKVTVSILKTLDWMKVYLIAHIVLVRESDDSKIHEITKEQFDLLFK